MVVSGAVLLNAASSTLSKIDPPLALALNPFNAEARIALALTEMDASSGSHTDDLRELIADGIRLAPIDARFYSLMGILEQQAGNRASASRLFDHALALMPTEFQALIHRLAYDIESNDLFAAVDRVEILGRRWRERWSLVEPALPVLLANENAANKLMSRFGSEQGLRRLLIGSLAVSANTLSHAYQVLVRWHRMGVDELNEAINLVTRRMIKEERYADAFLLFRLTRPREASMGYVYNGEFRLPPSGNPFDWQLKSQAGVDLRISRGKSAVKSGAAPGQGEHFVTMRFLDNPIRLKNVTQFVRLAPGNYRLAIGYASDDLTAPEPLQLAVRCVRPHQVLATIELVAGSTGSREDSAGFAIPPADCGLQEIYIFNEPMPMSWRNRYSGAIRIDHIAIAHAGETG